LIGDHREVIELGFKSKVVEKVNLNFHTGLPNSELQIGRHYPVFAFEVLCFRVSAAD